MSTNVCATVTVSGNGTFDADSTPFELSGETKEDVVRQAIDWFEVQSKRHNTTLAANPESTTMNFGAAWTLTLDFNDGTEETYPLSFPSLEVGTFSEDEAEWVRVSASIPVWSGPDELKLCVNGFTPDQVEKQMMEFASTQAGTLPRELLAVMAQWRMPIMFRVERTDGSVFKAGVYASAITEESSANFPSITDVLAALSVDEDDA